MLEQAHEKRHFPRIPFQAPVQIKNLDGDWNTQLKDLSLNGALIERPESWSGNVHDLFMIRLILPNSDVEIRMEVTVAHVEEQTIGLHCKHIDLDSITHLRRLVELNTGDPELLKRQLGSLG